MAISSAVCGQLAVRFAMLMPHLNERQRRLVLALEARLLGHGGVRAVARTAGASETTVRKGVVELDKEDDPIPTGKVRRPGGGRKRAEEKNPCLLPALFALVEPDERGDPMSPLRWTTKSLRKLAEELTEQGHRVSAVTVGRLLRQSGFSLQSHSKTLEGSQHPDRDAQFRYINEQVKQHQDSGEPVISVDTKKKEMLGQLPNPGREWRPKGDPIKVEDHSFFSGPKGETAIPYGIYDVTADTGWINVGTDHDTSVFAVTSIRRWWQARGCLDYPQATRLLITADAGGSNSYRYRVWKAELADLATQTGLSITVSHFPPGTSKWNKIEHRLFSHITMNWRARPLTSHEVVVKAIASTRTRTGLRVHAELDTSAYPLGVAITRAQLEALPIERHQTHGTWNYTIHPGDLSARDAPAAAGRTRDAAREAALELLAEPVLTGMTRDDLNTLAARLAPDQAAQRERRNHQLRGGRRRQAPGAHGRPLLCGKDHVLLTVLYLRQICSQKVMADLLGVTQSAIGPAIAETRELLEAHHQSIIPTTLRFSRRQEIEDYVRTGGVASGRPLLSMVLCDPVLTGMSRDDLDNLVDRLSLRQAALVERRRYKQRGGQRQPGTRGGVFKQKITDGERVLATVLYQRGVCTRDVLANLFEVSPRTIGNALLDVRPLLEEDGYTITPAPTRFSSAAALLASIESPS